MWKSLKALAVILLAGCLACTLTSCEGDSPRGQLLWSVAIARTNGNKPYESFSQLYVGGTGVVYVPSGAIGWRRYPTPSPNSPVIAMAADGHGKLVAGTLDGSVFISHDEGKDWISYTPSSFPVSSIVLEDPSNVLVASFGGGLWRIQDNVGDAVAVGGVDPNVWCLTNSNDGSLVAFTAVGVYESSDQGARWSRTGFPGEATQCSHDRQGDLIAVADGAMMTSQDDGHNTTSLIMDNGEPVKAWSVGTDPEGDMIVGTSQGVFWSQNRGHHWEPVRFNSTAYPNFLFPEAHAQEHIPDLTVSTNVGKGPTLLPMLPQPLTPAPTAPPLSAGNEAHALPPSAIPVGQRAVRPAPPDEDTSQPSSTSEDSSSDPEDDTPPPPPPQLNPITGVPVACIQDDNGNTNCPASDTEAYLNSVSRVASIVEAVNAVIRGNSWIQIGRSAAISQIEEQALMRLEQRLMDQAMQQIQAWAQAKAIPAAAVQAHTAYVQAVVASAIAESKGQDQSAPSHGRTSNTGSDHSGYRSPTLGPAFHQAVEVAAHGFGSM